MDELVRKMNSGLPELADCSPLASDILRTYILAEHLRHICDYFQLAEYKLQENSTTMHEAYWQQFFSFVAPRARYLTDNPLLMISADDFFFNKKTVFHQLKGCDANSETANTCPSDIGCISLFCFI